MESLVGIIMMNLVFTVLGIVVVILGILVFFGILNYVKSWLDLR